MCIYTDIGHLLARLDHQTLPERIDTMTNAALETSGYYNLPRDGDTWSSQMVEIKAHGISAQGASQEEAIRNWMKVAQNQMEAAAASSLLCSPDAIPVNDMKTACQTVMKQGAHHPEFRRAEMLLDVLKRTA